MEDLQKLEKEKQQLLFLASNIEDFIRIAEKIENYSREEIVGLLRDYKDEQKKRADAIHDLIMLRLREKNPLQVR